MVINNLAASMLWHKLNVLEPPNELIKVLQRRFVNFFWSGQHWLPGSVLYLPLQEGAQALIDVRSRINISGYKLHREYYMKRIKGGLVLLVLF